MQLSLNELSPETFLREYWQKKPLVIRQGLAGFQDFLTPDELAGLALDNLVESRRVYKKHGEWQAEFGPFESYDDMGDRDWSLIVQAVNNWVPEVDRLIQCFDFIPRWRFDDVMVSFATPGGGCGPHIDLYDVFVCQGSGRRRWRVGDRGPHKQIVVHSALLHTEAFEPIIDVELEAGDILYIPPHFPHDGVTLENSMSFSVGYRTASARDVQNALADYLIENELADQQIEDPDRRPCKESGKIDAEDFARIKHQLVDMLDDELVSSFAGSFLTRSKCELDLPDTDLDYDAQYVREIIAGQDLIRLGGLRCLYLDYLVSQGVLFLNGEQVELPAELIPVIPVLCNQQTLSAADLSPWLDQPVFVDLLVEWINKGYWYFEAEQVSEKK